jgi:hypothetical protein
MTEKEDAAPGRPDPQKVAILRSLSKEIMQTLTKEEIKALLLDDEWPDSLREKLKDFEKSE